MYRMIPIIFLNNGYFERIFHNIARICYHIFNRIIYFA